MNSPKLEGCETQSLGASHFSSFYGGEYKDNQFLGWAFVKDGECQGFFGTITLETGIEWSSITLRDGLSFDPLWYRHLKRLFDVFAEVGFNRTVCALDDDVPYAEEFLLRLGFTELKNASKLELLLADGKRLFEWRTHS